MVDPSLAWQTGISAGSAAVTIGGIASILYWYVMPAIRRLQHQQMIQEKKTWVLARFARDLVLTGNGGIKGNPVLEEDLRLFDEVFRDDMFNK